MNVGVLASGSGTNLQALLDQVHGRDGISIVAVASDKADAYALSRAAAAGVATRVFPVADYGDGGRAARDRAIADWLVERGVELVVLAGYMQLLSPDFIARFPERVINVHPALLPAFPGLAAVQQAIDYGVKVFGVTDPLRRRRGRFRRGHPSAGDRSSRTRADADAVLERLHPIEHELLPEAVRLIARGAVRLDPDHPRRVLINSGIAPARVR